VGGRHWRRRVVTAGRDVICEREATGWGGMWRLMSWMFPCACAAQFGTVAHGTRGDVAQYGFGPVPRPTFGRIQSCGTACTARQEIVREQASLPPGPAHRNLPQLAPSRLRLTHPAIPTHSPPAQPHTDRVRLCIRSTGLALPICGCAAALQRTGTWMRCERERGRDGERESRLRRLHKSLA
jgi:hypothetical protein